MQPSKYSEFDAAALHFSPMEKNKKGGKMVGLFLADKDGSRKKIAIQTPVVSVPFGVSPYQEANTGEIQSYSLDVSFRNFESDPRIADFMARMRRLDDVMLDTAVANSKEWFGKAMSKDVVKEFIRKLVRDPNNPQYAPTMKVKVPVINGVPQCRFFDEHQNLVDIDYVAKGSTVKVIMELSPSVWFVNKNFGVTWKAAQVQVMSRPRSLDTYAFIADESGGTPTEAAADPAPEGTEL